MTLQISVTRSSTSQWANGRARRAVQIACKASHTSRRAAVAAPMLLLPTVHVQPASAASSTSVGATAAGPWAFHRRQLLSLLSVSSDYNRYADTYDQLDDGAIPQALGFAELRAQLVGQAYGDVLEAAVGTGLNLPLYDPSRLTSLTALDISQGMLRQAAPRANELSQRLKGAISGPVSLTTGQVQQQQQQEQQQAGEPEGPVRLIVGDAAALPFADGSFDCVLDTFSLCVFERPAAAVAEMARVLRRGGRLLLLEHSKSDNLLLGAYQDLTNAAVQPLSKGCAWNQDVEGFVRAAGLKVVDRQRHLGGTITLLAAERT